MARETEKRKVEKEERKHLGCKARSKTAQHNIYPGSGFHFISNFHCYSKMNTKIFLITIKEQAKAKTKGTRGRQGKERRRWKLRDTEKRRKADLQEKK